MVVAWTFALKIWVSSQEKEKSFMKNVNETSKQNVPSYMQLVIYMQLM